jgi:anthranilate synthase component 2
LGHQSIAQVYGAKVVKAPKMMHGKTSQIEVIKEDRLFQSLPKVFTQTRYHSLIVEKNNLPDSIIVTSKSLDDDEIMSLKIKDKDIYGVQFHPESVMSEHGHKILQNFLDV